MVTEKRLIDANEVLQRNEEAFEKANKKTSRELCAFCGGERPLVR